MYIFYIYTHTQKHTEQTWGSGRLYKGLGFEPYMEEFNMLQIVAGSASNFHKDAYPLVISHSY